MAANNILQFAPTDTGTNLLTQAAYLAASDRTNGNQPGLASARLVNKALRQATLMAAGLAQFIADRQATDVSDTLTPSNIAAMLAVSAQGRFLNRRVFSSAGTYTPTTGTVFIDVHVVGGGGAGGGSQASGAGQASAGPGGGAGGYAFRRITSGFSGVAMTVGAGGTGVTGGAGTNGGSTSFGGLVAATGGNGAAAGIVASIATVSINGSASPGAGSSGDVNAVGGVGQYAFYAAVPVSGSGGMSFFGMGGGFVSSGGGAHGANASTPGAGGSGAVTAPGNGFLGIGGNGAQGVIIVDEYA